MSTVGQQLRKTRLPDQSANNREPKPFQFGLRQVMIIMAWVCAAFATLRFCGLLRNPNLLLAIGTWLCFQTLTTTVGRLLAPFVRQLTDRKSPLPNQ